MKVFSSILALYMMVLFMIPCADMYEKKIFEEHAHPAEIAHGHDHTATNDLCTPFCVCACCGAVSGVLLQWNSLNFGKVIFSDLPKPIMYYNSLFVPRYVGEIWQPPKINA